MRERRVRWTQQLCLEASARIEEEVAIRTHPRSSAKIDNDQLSTTKYTNVNLSG
jgi:hypothetical protein